VSKFLTAAVLTAAMASVGCGTPVAATEAPDLSGRTLRIVATTSMVTDVVTQVAGDRATVTGLMGSGIDPHGYKASERDVMTLAEADLVFYNGLHLEAKMSDVFERVEGRIVTAAVTDGLPRDRLVHSPQFTGAYDPHVWFDVSLWREAASEVADVLARVDPAHADVYARNAEDYREELARLDEDVRALVASVPRERRVLVTAHDAFGYFGRAYGFEVHGLQGISTVAEAGAADVQRLADFIAERRIPAVFVESSVPQQTIRAVQEAVGSRGFEVEIGGQLFSDAMGDPGTPEGTYPGMVLHNVRTIADALRDG
jgi:manganese/zinc/iron transport system substrate-binding protein